MRERVGAELPRSASGGELLNAETRPSLFLYEMR
jgi:hypothetical protein